MLTYGAASTMKALRPWLPLFALLAACDNATSPGGSLTDSAAEASPPDATHAPDAHDGSPPEADVPAADIPATDATTDAAAPDVATLRDAQTEDRVTADAPADISTTIDAPVTDIVAPIDTPTAPDVTVRDAPATDLTPTDVTAPIDVPTTPAPQLSQARSSLVAVVARDGKVYAIGGTTASVR